MFFDLFLRLFGAESIPGVGAIGRAGRRLYLPLLVHSLL